MSDREWQINDVVQIDPEKHGGGFFAGCFMTITEPKAFGAQGFVCIPGKRGEPPGQAFYRAKHDEMHFVGRAVFVPANDADD